MSRQILPNRRPGYNFELEYGNQNNLFHITVGYFPGTRQPAEVFISGAKAGSEVEAVARDGAVLLSIAFQHGAQIETISHAITRDAAGVPQTILGKVVDRLMLELKPHKYVPSLSSDQMGDCHICGHIRDSEIHVEE